MGGRATAAEHRHRHDRDGAVTKEGGSGGEGLPSDTLAAITSNMKESQRMSQATRRRWGALVFRCRCSSHGGPMTYPSSTEQPSQCLSPPSVMLPTAFARSEVLWATGYWHAQARAQGSLSCSCHPLPSCVSVCMRGEGGGRSASCNRTDSTGTTRKDTQLYQGLKAVGHNPGKILLNNT